MSFDFHRTIRRFIPKDKTPHITALKETLPSLLFNFTMPLKSLAHSLMELSPS
jgi:hypothetical protein